MRQPTCSAVSQTSGRASCPSVTPQGLITPDAAPAPELQFLAIGLDKLDLALFVPFTGWDAVTKRLYDLRSNMGHSATRPANWGGHDVLLHAKGTAYYPHHLETPDAHLFLSNCPRPTQYPNVRVSLKARALWHGGHAAPLNRVASFLAALGAVGEWTTFGGTPDHGLLSHHSIQRVDIAADFLYPSGFTSDDLACQRVTRARTIRDYHVSDHYTGTQVGSENIVLRIYNKTLELAQKDTGSWLWQHHGIPEQPGLWRLELQLRHKALSEYGVDHLDQLPGVLGGVWRNLLTNWFSLREPGGSNTTRRSFTPFWEAVLSWGASLGAGPDATRTRRANNPASPDWYVRHVKSALVGYAATGGQTDKRLAAESFVKELMDRFTDEEWQEAYTTKRVKIGARHSQCERK